MNDDSPYSALHTAIAEMMERTNAYRAALLESGYSETAAEMMTVDFHRMLLNLNTATP